MLGYYNYTVILTYVGMLSGFVGITFASVGNIRSAVFCLIIAGFCDMFDGKIASTMERTRAEKRFGVQIDSLSDLICFGVLPAMIVHGISSGVVGLVIPALYTLCALIRLAWFNVDEEERQDKESGRRVIYLGLPVTFSAVIFPLLLGLGVHFQWPLHILAPIVMLLTAAAFLTPFHLKKPSLFKKHKLSLVGTEETEEVTELK